MKFGYFMTFIVFWTCCAVLPAHADELPSLDHLKIYQDESGKMPPEAVLRLLGNPPDLKNPFTADTPAVGQPPRTVWWAVCQMQNHTSLPLAVVLSLDDAHIDRVDFYIKRAGQWEHARESDSLRYPARMLTLAPQENVPVLIRISSEEAFLLRPKLRTETSWDMFQRRAALWDGSLFGGLLALGWSAFLIAVFSRNRAFFLLAALCVTITLFEAAFRGYPHVYLWQTSRQFDIRISHIAGYLTMALFFAFILSVADGEKARVPARRTLSIFIWLNVLGAIVSALWKSSFLAHADIWLHAISTVLAIAVAAVLVIQRAPTAKLMLITIGFAFFNLLARTLEWTSSWGLTPPVPWITSDIYPNPVIALIGLATNLAVLAAWIQHVGKQRSEARQQLLDMQQTEQERLHKEVQARTAELRHALSDAWEKNQQKIEMVSYIGHDLRVPLATIKGYLTLLGKAPGHRQPGIVHAITRSVTYQLSLIDELMEYTKAELHPLEIHPQSTDLPTLLDNIAEYALALCQQQSNHFDYVVRTVIPALVDIDATRIQQVLLNLLSNASKFTTDGSVRLVVEAHRRDTNDNAWLLGFSVFDTGIGMDLSEDTDIFGAYQQIQRSNGSTGLGLFIAERIVSSMGGKLQVESTPGQGSRFSFDFGVVALDATVAGPSSLSYPVIRSAPSGSRESLASDVPMQASCRPDILELLQLVRNGRLTDIEQWINQVASAPDHPTFLPQIQAYLDRLDLSGLERFAASLVDPSR